MHKHLLAAVLRLAVAMTGASALDAHAKTTFVTIRTGGITGVYYPTGGAIAKIVNAKKDKYDIRATVESTGASVFNITAIMAGDLEFGIAQADRQYPAYNGLSEWEGKPQKDLRAVFALAPEADTFVAAEESRIKSPKDAKCKVVNIGNPGPGKTTIARLEAKSLKAIGALGGGQLVEVTRADLVGRYTGHTAPLTNSVIESALGGVLFIDEAYSLYRGQQDSFGLEAIDTLVKGMEDHRDELVVILAGYTKEMEVFLTANSGLASRFPNKIEFPDYTADELLDITAVPAKGKGYRLAESCTFPLLGYYKRRQALDSRTAGNGRLARNTLEKAIFNQSRRLIAEPAAPLDLIQPSDLEFEE